MKIIIKIFHKFLISILFFSLFFKTSFRLIHQNYSKFRLYSRYLINFLYKIKQNLLLGFYKKTPISYWHSSNFDGIDYFLSGRFNFSNDHRSVQKEHLARIYLTKNEWSSYYSVTKSNDIHPKRVKIVSDKIKIAFFCSYSDSHFFDKTIAYYAKNEDKIKWYLCKFADFPLSIHSHDVETVIFKDLKSALDFCDNDVDFIIDADGPLRPTLTSELVKYTKSYVLNYYNLITSSNKNYFDALIVPIGCKPAPLISEKKVIEINALGGWYLPAITHQTNNFKKYDIGIIAEQFKLGPKFYSDFAFLSLTYTFIFIGMKYPKYVIFKMKKYGWNLSNITFHNHISPSLFPLFLKRNIYTLLDVPNYSSGSGTIIGLSVGVPTICFDGDFWINQMASCIMQNTNNANYIYRTLSDIKKIIDGHKLNFKDNEVNIEKNSRVSSYLNPENFISELHNSLVLNFS